MNDHEEWIERLHSILEVRIQELFKEFMVELMAECEKADVTLSFHEFSDVYNSTPEDMWTGKMHDIYGQARALDNISDLLSSRIQDSTPWEELKPYLLGKDR